MARAAPSTRASNLAHMMEGWTRGVKAPWEKPQSLPPRTFSRPTDAGVVDEALGNEFGVFDVVGGVGDDAGDEALAVGQLGGLPDLPLVGVAGIGGFYAVGSSVDAQDDVHDIAQGYVGGVRAVPATPAEVVADAVLGQAFEGRGSGRRHGGWRTCGSPRWWVQGRGCRTG